MLFKSPELAREFFQVHPDLRRALFDLDAKLEEWDAKAKAAGDAGFPPLTITHLVRTPEQQEAIYWKTYGGVPEAVAREKARRKFSWHLLGCGSDIRRHVYSEKQIREIRAFLYQRCPAPMWEFLDESTTGTGPHFHLAIRDFERRREFERVAKTSTGAV